MAAVVYTARARADLEDIWLRIATDSPAAADRLIDRIAGRCASLGDHPELGPRRPEIAADARMLVIDDYLALYRSTRDGVVIVRVVHGARRLEGLFDQSA